MEFILTGHDAHLVFDKERASWSRGMISALGAEGPGASLDAGMFDPRRSPRSIFFVKRDPVRVVGCGET